MLTKNYFMKKIIMKKIILISAVSSMIAVSAFAKTEGDYGSVNWTYNRAQFGSDDKTVSASGVGIELKHAFNQDKIFLAPAIFAEWNHLNRDVNSTNVTINNRYGAKLNLGYDFNDDVALYIVGGYSFLNYRTNSPAGAKTDRAKGDLFYGIGLTQSLNKDWALNFEYNYQEFDLSNSEGQRISTNYDTVKLGMNYKF